MKQIEKSKKLIQQMLERLNADTILYVNYPFCAGRCRYCIYHIDHYTSVKNNNFFNYYRKEISLYAKHLHGFKFKRIYIGGGTPNLAKPELLIGPLYKLVDFEKIDQFKIDIFPRPDIKKYLENLKKYRVTKINLGVQTLDDEILKSENRIFIIKNKIRFTTKEIIIDCLKVLSESGLSWAVDLIYNLNDPRKTREYIREIETILRYKPSGFHLYNLRRQQSNGYYGNKSTDQDTAKTMELFDFRKISYLLKRNSYKLIGDEWCLDTDKDNQKRAQHEADFFGEPDTVGLGLSARSRTRFIKYINTRQLEAYSRLLDRGLFPIDRLFNYQEKFYLISNVLLSINESSEFNLKKIIKNTKPSGREIEQLRSLMNYLKINNINIIVKNNDFFIPRSDWARCLRLIEGYLNETSGVEYFYKN